jgi:hypothetical protein
MDEEQSQGTNPSIWAPTPAYTPPPGIDQGQYVFGPSGSSGPLAPTTTPMPNVTVPPVPGNTPGAPPSGFGNTVKNIATTNQPMGSDWKFGAQPAMSTDGTRDLTNDPSMRDRMNQAAADKAAAARQGLTYSSPYSGMF